MGKMAALMVVMAVLMSASFSAGTEIMPSEEDAHSKPHKIFIRGSILFSAVDGNLDGSIAGGIDIVPGDLNRPEYIYDEGGEENAYEEANTDRHDFAYYYLDNARGQVMALLARDMTYNITVPGEGGGSGSNKNKARILEYYKYNAFGSVTVLPVYDRADSTDSHVGSEGVYENGENYPGSGSYGAWDLIENTPLTLSDNNTLMINRRNGDNGHVAVGAGYGREGQWESNNVGEHAYWKGALGLRVNQAGGMSNTLQNGPEKKPEDVKPAAARCKCIDNPNICKIVGRWLSDGWATGANQKDFEADNAYWSHIKTGSGGIRLELRDDQDAPVKDCSLKQDVSFKANFELFDPDGKDENGKEKVKSLGKVGETQSVTDDYGSKTEKSENYGGWFIQDAPHRNQEVKAAQEGEKRFESKKDFFWQAEVSCIEQPKVPHKWWGWAASFSQKVTVHEGRTWPDNKAYCDRWIEAAAKKDTHTAKSAKGCKGEDYKDEKKGWK